MGKERKMGLHDEDKKKIELLNFAVMLRSAMIGRDEFLARARQLGFSGSVEEILDELPLEGNRVQ